MEVKNILFGSLSSRLCFVDFFFFPILFVSGSCAATTVHHFSMLAHEVTQRCIVINNIRDIHQY
jgi:hypothetical protein